MRTCMHNNTHVYLFGEFKRPKYVAPNIAGPNSFQCSIYLAGSIPQQRFGISNISISCWNGIGPAGKKTCKYPREKTFCSSQVFTRLVPLFNLNSSFGAIMSNHFWGIRSLDAQNKPLPSRKVWLKLSTARAGTHQAQNGQQVKVKCRKRM